MNADTRNLRRTLLAATVAAVLASASTVAAEPLLPAVAPDPTAANAPLLSTQRLIVRYKDAALSPAAKRATVDAAARRARMSQPAAAGARRVPAAAPAVMAAHSRRLGTGAEVIELSQRVGITELQAIIAEVSTDPAVAWAAPDQLLQHTGIDVQPALVPNDPFYGQYQWHLKATPGGANVEPAHDVADGSGVVVAVIDTGIVAHPDMDANMLPGYDFISDPFVSRRPTNERVPGAADLGDWRGAEECGAGSPSRNSSWHGTHVAGTIAELSNNAIGMAGVAPGAKVLPIRALGRCGGYTSDIADAIAWAAGASVSGVPDNTTPAEVINLSLGGGGSCDPTTQEAINFAVSRGTTVVVAAGNSNGDVANFSPASCANVVSVAAAGITGARASYSNYGDLIDLAAPGGGVNEGNPNGYVWQAVNSSTTSPELGGASYGAKAGTSMAAPHVAGVVALVQSAVTTPLTPAAVEQLLKDNVRAFPATPDRPIGPGLLDAQLVLTAALAPPGETPATPLTNKVAVTNVSGASGGSKLYSIDVAAGARLLNVMTYGGSGDVSVYISRDVRPTSTAYGWRSARPGNSEAVRVSNPTAGTYYVLVLGETNFSGLSVQARVD